MLLCSSRALVFHAGSFTLLSSLLVAIILWRASLGSPTPPLVYCALWRIFISCTHLVTPCDLVGPHMRIIFRVYVDIPMQPVSSLGMTGLCSAPLGSSSSSILLIASLSAGPVSASGRGRVLDSLPVDLLSPQPTSSLRLWSVGRGTRKMSPFHINHETDVFNFLTQSSGGGNIWATYHTFAIR